MNTSINHMKPSVNTAVETDVTQQPTCYQPVQMIVQFKTLKLLIAIVMLSASHFAHAQCASIVSDPAGQLCTNEPVTFEVINLGALGSVLNWETSTDIGFNGGLISGLLGVNDSITFPDGFTAGTYYIRAQLLLSGCTYTQPFQFNVYDPISTNNISCDITEIDCSTTLPIVFTGEQDSDLHAATSYIWQTFDGNNWNSISSNSPNLSLTQLGDQDVYVRRVINPVACEQDTSNVIHLPRVEYPDGGTIVGDSASCVDNEPGTLTLNGFNGDIVTWEYSTDGSSFSEIDNTENAVSYTPQNTPGTHYYRVKVENGNCEPVYSNVLPVVIHSSIINYLITPDQHVCENEIPSDIIGSNPTGGSDDVSPLWVKREINETSWEIVPNQPDFIAFDAPLTTTTYYLRYLSGTYCESVSDTAAVFVSPLSDAGNFVGNENSQTLCPGTEATPVGITNFTGEIQDWYYAADTNDVWTAIGHADSIYSPGIVEEETYYKVVIKTENCDSVWSEVYSIDFYPKISNNTIENSQVICENTQPAALQGSSPTGGDEDENFSYLWEYRTEYAEWNTAPGINDLQDYTPQVIEETTFFRRIVSSGDCPKDTSNTLEIAVDQPAETGNFTDIDGVQEICPGEITETITIQNYTGTIVDWYEADQPEGPWTPLGFSEDEFSPGQIDDSTYFRVGISTEFCGETFSEVYSIELYPAITENTISGDQAVCPEESLQPLTGPMPEGANGVYELMWQTKTEGAEWMNANGTNDSLAYIPNGLTESTFFRRIVSSGSCPPDTSNVLYIEQLEAPYGTFFSADEFYCPGDPLEITVNLNGEAPFTIQFNDGADTLTVDGIVNNPHTITVTADTTTTYTLTHVWDANCASGDMVESAVEIIPVPEIGAVSAGPDTSICDLSHNLSGSPILEDFQTCTWTDENGNVLSESPEFTFNSESPGDYELTYTVFSEDCNDSTSSTVVVTTDEFEPAFAGNDQQICNTSTTLNAAPLVWGSGFWMVDPDIGINNLFDSLATLSGLEYGNTYTLTWFTHSENGICPIDSSSVTISVDPLSNAGELNASADEICAGNEITFSLSNQVGGVNAWLFSDDEEGDQTVNSDATTMASDELITDTEVAVVVQSGTCSPDTSNSLFVDVSPPTNPGTLSSDQQVCEGENGGSIEMNDFEGEILYWEYSTDNFQSSETIFSNQTSYAFENLETTTQFRTNVQSGSCEAAMSNAVTIEVINEILTPFELDQIYCSNDETIDLNTLIDDNTSGTWNINGINTSTFNPAEYANSEVFISFTNNENSCGGTTSESTIVNAFPEVEISAPEEICGLNTEINATSSAGSGMWAIGEELVPGGELNTSNIEIMALSYGAHEVTWTAENNGCSNEATHTLTFFESPDSSKAGENQLLDFTYETRLDANQPEVGTGEWSTTHSSLSFSDIHDPKANVRNLGVGKNNLRWTITNGSCPSSSSEVTVDVKGLIIPDAFSPNGDNVNDRYVIRGIDAIGPVSLKVWNRWGGIVYESTDYQNDWEGLNENGNELPADTYYYLLKADGLNDVFKGFIVIQR